MEGYLDPYFEIGSYLDREKELGVTTGHCSSRKAQRSSGGCWDPEAV